MLGVSSLDFARTARLLLLVLFSVLGANGCGSNEARVDQEEAGSQGQGSMRLPLITTTAAGLTLRLRGTFSVTPSGGDEPLLSLSTETAPDATVLTATLPVGFYHVTLQDGWVLEQRMSDDTRRALVARLANQADQFVAVRVGETTDIRYSFYGHTPADTDGGGISITIDFAEEPVCGDGLVEGDERCDYGEDNGSANACDKTCRFYCSGPCPLRVDPAAAPGGSGGTWQEPLSSLQTAIDRQAELGGGEVWLIEGEFDLPPISEVKLLELRSNVRILGGFQGSELAADQRPSPAHVTTLRDRRGYLSSDFPEGAITASGVANVMLERLRFAPRSRPFAIDSSDVAFSYVTFEQPSNWKEGVATNSVVRFQNCLFNYGGLQLIGSRVVSRDTNFVGFYQQGLYSNTGIYAVDTQLSIERAVMDITVALQEGSSAFISNTALRTAGDRGAVIRGEVDGALPTSLILMDSSILDASTLSPVSATNVMVVNSSFVDLRPSPSAGLSARAAAVEAKDLEVSSSTFYKTGCDQWGNGCYARLVGTQSFAVNNSLFTEPLPHPNGPPPAVYPQTSGQGNCYVREDFPFRVIPGTGRVLPEPHACSNAGDAEALEASRLRLMELAQPFLAEPFYVSLYPYYNDKWWEGTSASHGMCGDSGRPDPGRHSSCDLELSEQVLGCAARGWGGKASFDTLPTVTDGDVSFRVHSISSVSADGSTIVGYGTVGGDPFPVLWRYGRALPFGTLDYERRFYRDVVSCDGSSAVFSNVKTPSRWTEQTGMVPFAPELSDFGVTGISADGSVIVGAQNTEEGFKPLRWKDDELQTIYVNHDSGAIDVSWDGQYVFATKPRCELGHVSGACTTLFRWVENEGEEIFHQPVFTSAAISSNGKVLGVAEDDKIYLYQDSAVNRDRVDCPGRDCEVRALSSEGRIMLLEVDGEAWLYSVNRWHRRLRSILADEGVLVNSASRLAPIDMSDDGRVIVGMVHTGGNATAFYVQLPHRAYADR